MKRNEPAKRTSTRRKSIKSLARHSDIKTHINHSTKKQFRCKECGRCYKTKQNLDKHRKQTKHSIARAKITNNVDHQYDSEIENSLDFKISALFTAILSGESVDEINDKRSIRRVSNGFDKSSPFRCDECRREFSLFRGLMKHHRTVHTAQDPIECKRCGKLFKHRVTLYRHRRLCSQRNNS